jgi:MYXO-CTERM domain-containing protein
MTGRGFAGASACLLFALPCVATSAVLQPPSCLESDVAAAVAQASAGDTVLLPACPSGVGWSTSLSVDAGIAILGQGIGQTVLIDNIPKGDASCNGGAPMIAVSVAAPEAFQLSSLTIEGGPTRPYACGIGHVMISGSTQAMRVDHVFFQNQQTVGIVSWTDWGVIDHCQFLGNYKVGVTLYASDQNAAWNEPTDLGTDRFVFIEDCTFQDPSAGGAFSGSGGARLVARHNQLSLGLVGGAGWSERGSRAFEVYDNTFSAVIADEYGALSFGGGTGVIHDNTFDGGYSFTLQAIEPRDSPGSPPWGPCDGTSPYDENTDGGTGYACLDQVGRGAGTLLSGYPPVPAAWPSEQIEPVYSWGNTFNGATGVLIQGSVHVQASRDYFDNTPMPGYVPYPYPHPLTLVDGGQAPVALSPIRWAIGCGCSGAGSSPVGALALAVAGLIAAARVRTHRPPCAEPRQDRFHRGPTEVGCAGPQPLASRRTS